MLNAFEREVSAVVNLETIYDSMAIGSGVAVGGAPAAEVDGTGSGDAGEACTVAVTTVEGASEAAGAAESSSSTNFFILMIKLRLAH